MAADQEKSFDTARPGDIGEESKVRATDYTAVIVCARPVEIAAMRGMLDQEHTSTGLDKGTYVLGSIGGHNIVLASLGASGMNDANATVLQVLHDFSSIRFGLLVGSEAEYRAKASTSGLVMLWSEVIVDRDVGHPPKMLTDAVERVHSSHLMGGDTIYDQLDHLLSRRPGMRTRFGKPPKENDKLFMPGYQHEGEGSCVDCDKAQVISRPARLDDIPNVFCGTVGLTNATTRESHIREDLSGRGILCIDRELTGLVQSFPCLAVRGICDYADSHKYHDWHGYAAATAAAYARALLLDLEPASVPQLDAAKDVVNTDDVDDFLLPNVNTIWTVPGAPTTIPANHAKAHSRFKDECKKGMNWKDPDNKIMLLDGVDKEGHAAFTSNFAWLVRRRFWAVFYIRASSESELERALLQQVASHHQTNDWQAAKAWIEGLKQHWLFILLDTSKDKDSHGKGHQKARPATLDYTKYIPTGSGGLVLISSDLKWSATTLRTQTINCESSASLDGYLEWTGMIIILVIGFIFASTAVMLFFTSLAKYVWNPMLEYLMG
ncbi:nucleoside phosphorylase domain-containing protein [Elsinoe ampelina]|uniref:Nucleoside phosphorylase domain-containing protein n=1 Tax=Elsinoe ampelina TaxID=302913 RepID=A0A6A6GLY6_9PEZI|nr:nucleoside phosphorylase domain-containing protein [Elsinoe ampelina]